MNLKNFDFKELMLKHGQFVALGIGLLFLIPLVLLGLEKVFSSGRASANAKVLMDQNKRASDAIAQSHPPEDASKPPLEFLMDLKTTPIDPIPYDTVNPWFVPSTIEDTKRRNPEVLLASNFKPDLVRAAIESYITRPTGKGDFQVLVLAEKAPTANKLTGKRKKQFEAYLNLLKKAGLSNPPGQGAGGGFAGGPGGGFSGPGGGKAGGMMGGPGGFGGGGMGMGARGGATGDAPGGGFGGGLGAGMLGNSPGQRVPGMVRRTEYVDIDKINDQRLAQEIRPARLVVINGSFPYRKELEEFRSKLRKRSLTELMALIDSGEATFEFRGFEVQRQTYGPDGKIKVPWQDRTNEMIEAINAINALAIDFAPEDPKMIEYGLLNPGLVASRPRLAREAQYPATDIKSLNDAIYNLNKMMKPDSKRPTSDLARKLTSKKAFNAYNPFNPFKFDEEEEVKPAGPKQAMPAKEAEKIASEDMDAELFIPDNVLVRLIDVVEPGNSYEYRLKVKMANPNYKLPKAVAYAALAKPEELVAGDWSMVPKIEVPRDTFWYAVDGRADPEKVTLQIQRWVDYTLPPSDLTASNGLAVADWCIYEREPAFRGGYIGRVENVEVPVWSTENEAFEFAHVNRRRAQIPIDFTVKEAGARSAPALLVDFSGGKGHITRAWGKTIREDLPLELLVVNSDGRLVLRNSVDDEGNTERSTREQEWRDWHNKVRRAGTGRPQVAPGAGAGGKGPGGIR